MPLCLIWFSYNIYRCSVNVTFWDSLAEEFDLAINQIEQYPSIIIIASAKITSWQGTKQTAPSIEISNVTATKFYLDYDHPNVQYMRRMYNSLTSLISPKLPNVLCLYFIICIYVTGYGLNFSQNMISSII